MMLFAFSCGDSASSSDNAATTIQNAGCCRNSTVGIAGLLSGYGRRRQRLDERFWQVVFCGDALDGADQLSTE